MPDTAARNGIDPRGWVVFLLASGALVVIHGAMADGAWQRALYVLVTVGVAGMAVTAVRRLRPWPLTAWGLLAGSLVAAAVGSAVWVPVEAGRVSAAAADVFFFAGFLAVNAGVWLFARAEGGRGGSAEILDTAIVVVGTMTLTWVLVVDPLRRGVPLDADARAMAILSPMAAVVLMALVARLLFGARKRVEALWLIGAGLPIVVVADLIEALTALGGVPFGDLAETLRLGGFVIAGSSVLHPSVGRLSPPAVSREQAGPTRVAVLWAVSVAVPLLLVLRAEVDVLVVAGGSVVLFTLVVARLWLLLGELRAAIHEEHDERFRALVDDAQVGMMIVDVDGVASYVSGSCERMCGHRIAGTGDGYLELFAPEDRERLRRAIRVAADDPRRRVVQVEGPLRHQDGSHRRLELTLANHLATPAIGGIVVTVHDVTAHHELEQRLAAAAQLKDDLLSMASHELRTPLTPIVGFLELIDQRSDNLTTSQREMVTRMAANARRLLRLMDDLLVVRQATADVLRAQPEEVVVADVIRASVELSGIPPDDVRIDAEGFRLHIDPQHLEQIVTNLLSNAVKYGRPPVHVSLIAGVPGRVRLEVRDHGEGVPPGLRTSMWGRFVQGDRGDNRTSTGTGLGLTIVKLLAEANDGCVHYYDADPAGAVFVVEVPGSPIVPSPPVPVPSMEALS